MERITSFSVDHSVLKKGIYLSRVDGDILTYDLRFTAPNIEKALDPKAAHAIEHIGATLLRNGKYKEKVIYFGPMGCMTGFYLLVKDLTLEEIKSIVINICQSIVDWNQEIPGAKMEECGNFTYFNLENAKEVLKSFLSANLEYEYVFLEEK